MEGRTVVVIAHRLSTIQRADVIFVVKDGGIAESGKHDDLMKLNGVYAELHNIQFNEEEMTKMS
jgi:subfamily B ATP-binding cassette protein MsbA